MNYAMCSSKEFLIVTYFSNKWNNSKVLLMSSFVKLVFGTINQESPLKYNFKFQLTKINLFNSKWCNFTIICIDIISWIYNNLCDLIIIFLLLWNIIQGIKTQSRKALSISVVTCFICFCTQAEAEYHVREHMAHLTKGRSKVESEREISKRKTVQTSTKKDLLGRANDKMHLSNALVKILV